MSSSGIVGYVAWPRQAQPLARKVFLGRTAGGAPSHVHLALEGDKLPLKPYKHPANPV